VDGARLILQSDEDLDLAAVVAYEHHIMLNGSGYPVRHYQRPCALASRLVHVCDVYDALRTKRPYRDAWESGKVLTYLTDHAGVEFEPDLVDAFVRMLQQEETRVAVLHDETSALTTIGT
jgi:putative two-component system response regulator